MNVSLSRVKKLALRRLWEEGNLYRARRRCRTLITTPFAAIGGLAWGVFSAPVIGVGSPVLWGALGAFAFPFFMYVQQRLVPGFSELARRLGFGNGVVASLALDGGVAGGLVYLLTRVMGAPVVPAVGTALGIGAFYTMVMEYVLCGSAAASVANLIGGGGIGGSRRSGSGSHAQALARRGAHGEAIAIQHEAIERRPREGSGYTRLARTLVETGDYEEAVAVLRRGFDKASLTSDQEAFFVRQIHAVCTAKMGTAMEALVDLRLLLERQPEGAHAEWATREIEDIEGGVYEDG